MASDKNKDGSANDNPKYEQIAKEIALKIFNNEFDTKEPLPNEQEMQKMFDVGRSTIRDSIKHLKSKGIIVTKTKIGTTICPINDWNYLDAQLIEWIMESPLKDKVQAHFLVLRKLIEPEVSSLSAVLLSDDQLTELSEVWKLMEEIEKDFDHAKWVENDLKFHEIIYNGSSNLLFISFFKIYKVIWFSTLSQASNYGDTCYMHHRAIYNALMERDPRKAKNSSIMHLEHSTL